MPRRLLRRLPFLLILLAALAGVVVLRDQFTLDALARHHAALAAFRDDHALAAMAAFFAAYVLIVALSLPGATVATLAGGFLFGLFPGVLLNVTAATVGAVAVFLAARMGFGAETAARLDSAGGAAGRLRDGLRQNLWSVLFLMRLVPAVPFFLANLLPAFAGVGIVPFAVTTFLGILPAALVFTSIGAGLEDVFARGGTPDLSVLGDPLVFLPLLGLCALAALPILLRAGRSPGR